MPAWKGRFSEEQIDAVNLYIKPLWSDEVYAIWHGIEGRALAA
jgi:mono/diheme cytochrome c family protein